MEEYISVVESTSGKRKRRNSSEWDKTKRKKARNSSSARMQPTIAFNHEDTSFCRAMQLSELDIKDFFNRLYENENVNDQNSYLMPYVVPYAPDKKRARKDEPRNRISKQHLIRKMDGSLLPVSSKTFLSIVGLGVRRINGLASHFFEAGETKKETRGGSRVNSKQLEQETSMRNFIKKLQVRESHYGRGTSTRQYLPSDLSIAKLWRMWRDHEGIVDNSLGGSLSKFISVFNNNFNLSFMNPRTDVCSTCEIYKNKISAGIQPEVTTQELNLHNVRAKRFYEILKETQNEPDVLTITFDMQQNQPLPKTNVGEAYYARQMWVYNFTIVIHSKDKKQTNDKDVFTYTWLESDSGKGSNEITSALAHFFENFAINLIKNNGYRRIKMFCNSCPGQNKNVAMLCFLVQIANNPTIRDKIKDITMTFPIKGHSYMPPDRVFGRIEKKIRKLEIIKTPAEYHELFEAEGSVFVYPDDWSVFDYKTFANSTLQNMNKVKMQSSRVWMLKPRNFPNSVYVSKFYAGDDYFKVDIVKPKIIMRAQKPKLVPSRSHVSQEKKKDVLKLLDFVKLNPQEKAFYDTELAKSVMVKKKKSK